MNVPLWSAVAVVAITVVAARADVRTRRIPNMLTGPALLAALVAHAVTRGTPGLSDSALGLLVAGGMLLPGWFLGWMGAGDVKLMAAVGAWVGFPIAMFAALFALMAGGVLALIVAVRHGALKRALWGATVLGSWAATQGLTSSPPPVTTGIRFPFAIAVLAGSLAVLVVRI